MSGLNSCACPATVLDTITDPDGCRSSRHGKVARMVFQEVVSTNNFIDGTNGIEEATSWSGLADASDDTKISVTPYLTDVIFGETEPIEGTENLDGATTADGVGAQLITAIIENPNPAQAAAINNLACKTNVGVFFVYNDDYIQGNVVNDSPLTYGAVMISPDTFSGSTPSREGTGASPRWQYKIQFKVNPAWWEESAFVAPEAGFSYKTGLLPS